MDHKQLVNPIPQGTTKTPKVLIPLMAVLQHTNGKVHPVMDYRELNEHVDAFTYVQPNCEGVNMALLDLQRAYLQIRVNESPWVYQMVLIKGERYCLTRLGFRLNVAPMIMKAIYQ